MQLAIQELWEIGAFQVPFHPETPLFLVFWVLLVLGALIQEVLLKKVKSPWARRSFALLLLTGLLAGELGSQLMIGFERLAPILIYWACLTLLLGAALPGLFCFLRTKVRHL